MNDFKTPVARLARVFREARDNWRAKALERQARLRAAQVRLRDLEHSRAYWKARALAAETLVSMSQQPPPPSDTPPASSEATGAPPGDEDPPRGAVLRQSSTPVANHHYSLGVMELSVHLYLHVHLGCRSVTEVLRRLTAPECVDVPAYTTVLNWCYRLGLALLQRPRPRREDWIFILDLTLSCGELKCLVLLGLPASRLTATGYSPRHTDMTVLAVEITTKSTGAWIEGVLTRVAQQAGEPVQILSDHGGDVRKGVSLFCQSHPQCVETYDISHATANALKAHWRHDTQWSAFVQQASATLKRCQQSDLAFLQPPIQRAKARYMAIGAQIQWAQRLLAFHDRGDFSALKRPCVFSAMAWERLCQLWEPSRVKPLKALIGQRYDTRQALSAALHQALIAQHAPDFEYIEDDAFWRLADQGYARFLHAFEWVLDYRALLPPWAHTLAISTTIQTELKTHGLSRHSAQTLKAKLDAPAPLPPPVADFQARLLEQVERQAEKLPPGVTWMASSDIIESVLGRYKRFTERGPLKEIGKLVLTIPAFLTDLTAPLIREAMESVRLLDVEQWVDAHLGESMLKRRRQALKPTQPPTPQLALQPT